MSHTIKIECPRCGAADGYRYPHRLWIQAYGRHPIGGRRVRVRAASPVEVVRCRSCRVAFSCAPPGGRHRVGYLLPVESAVIERAEQSA